MNDKFGILQLYETIPNGREWFSTKWNNGKTRTLKIKDTDPYDPNLEYTDGQPRSAMTINGDGTATCKLPSTSYRIYVKGPWCNTEQTCYVKVMGKARDVQLHSRSSHSLGGSFNIPLCKFAGYHVIFDRNKNVAMVECEVLDHIISRNLVSKKIPTMGIDKWIGYKQITRTINSNGYVLIEGYMNTNYDKVTWNKSVEYTFTGKAGNTDFTPLHNNEDGWYKEWQDCKKTNTAPATDLIKHSRWTLPEQMNWIRINDAENVIIKDWSIREIAPLL